MIGRGQFTSREAAALHRRDADKLHREEYVDVSVQDAERLGLTDGEEVTLESEHGRMRIKARVTDIVPEGAVWVPLLYDGGAVTALLGPEDGPAGAVRVQVRAMARV